MNHNMTYFCFVLSCVQWCPQENLTFELVVDPFRERMTRRKYELIYNQYF